MQTTTLEACGSWQNYSCRQDNSQILEIWPDASWQTNIQLLTLAHICKVEGSILYSWLKLQYTTASSGNPYWERVVTMMVRGTSSPVAALLLIYREQKKFSY